MDDKLLSRLTPTVALTYVSDIDACEFDSIIGFSSDACHHSRDSRAVLR
jgi:hypothetical protein